VVEAVARCPRCGGAFHCGVADEQACPCTTVSLDAALQQRLRERFSGCLCIACLAAVARGSPFEPMCPAAR